MLTFGIVIFEQFFTPIKMQLDSYNKVFFMLVDDYKKLQVHIT
jgi:hypothetical protein